MKFEELDLNIRIKKALNDINYIDLSPIQQEAINPILNNLDILGCAQTGSGKTAAFMLPIMNKIINSGERFNIRALILVPTRELAVQIHENTVKYAKYTNIRTTSVFGGVKDSFQRKKIEQGVDILIATPGRLLDFINQKLISVNNIEHLVLDEADRILDMGFIKDVNKIVDKLPKKRQTMLFSATLPQEIISLCDNILNNPVSITVNPPTKVVDNIVQHIYMINKSKKINLLLDLIKQTKEQILIFARTKSHVDKIEQALLVNNISVGIIHSDKSQVSRQEALKSFKKKKIQVLVATDIASRGIDIDSLTLVINYDLPDNKEGYIHRIGRTARAGRDGMAISFCSNEELRLFNYIKSDLNLDIKQITHKYEEVSLEVFSFSKLKQM